MHAISTIRYQPLSLLHKGIVTSMHPKIIDDECKYENCVCQQAPDPFIHTDQYPHVFLQPLECGASLRHYSIFIGESTAERLRARVWSPEGPGSSPETADFLKNRSGQTTHAKICPCSPISKNGISWLYSWLGQGTVRIKATQSHSGEHLMAVKVVCNPEIC